MTGTSNRTADSFDTFKMTDTVWKDEDSFTKEERASIKNVFTVSNMLGHSFTDLIEAAQASDFEGAASAAKALKSAGAIAMKATQERHENQVAKRLETLATTRAERSIVMPNLKASEDDFFITPTPAKRARKAK